eukprot:757013-Hanusia_phi.AAC.6
MSTGNDTGTMLKHMSTVIAFLISQISSRLPCVLDYTVFSLPCSHCRPHHWPPRDLFMSDCHWGHRLRQRCTG